MSSSSASPALLSLSVVDESGIGANAVGVGVLEKLLLVDCANFPNVPNAVDSEVAGLDGEDRMVAVAASFSLTYAVSWAKQSLR